MSKEVLLLLLLLHWCIFLTCCTTAEHRKLPAVRLHTASVNCLAYLYPIQTVDKDTAAHDGQGQSQKG
jgi:hypothetical protein